MASKLALAVMACLNQRALDAAIEHGGLSKSDVTTINALRRSGSRHGSDVAKSRLMAAVRKRSAERDRMLANARTLIEDYARKKVQEEMQMPTLLERNVAKAADTQRALHEAIIGYQASHPGCTPQDAIDKILLSRPVSDLHQAERRLAEMEKAARIDKLGGGTLPQYTDATMPWGWPLRGTAGYDSSKDGRPPHNPDAGEEPAIHDHNELLEQIRSGQIPFTDPRVSALVRLERKVKFGS